jgi:protein-S-isoprenylcysteine O-methyltransferase Ste14
MRWLELKIPPPAVAVIFGVVMWLASRLVARLELPFVVRVTVTVIIACAGLVFGVAAMRSFVRAKTTMNPIKPGAASSLVTGGVFGVTRNPMYLSLLLYLLAWSVYLASWPAVVFLPLFVLYITQFQIKPEERTLSTLFGAQYSSYMERVRRWL